MNSVNIIGNNVRDVELRTLSSGTAVADITVAIEDRKKGGEKETYFVDCSLWGRTAEIAAEYLRKGHKVGVTGRIKEERWEKDGQKRSKIKIVADRLDLLTSRSDERTNERTQWEPEEAF